jgi:oligoribonuclease NrnB/cAMP/cGMP phosphodiesterase (DHH superfamily)
MAGCELAWEYFFPVATPPSTVQLLGRYDVWDNENKEKWDTQILPFQEGLKMWTANDPRADIWTSLLEEPLSVSGRELRKSIIAAGKLVLGYSEALFTEAMRAAAFSVYIDQVTEGWYTWSREWNTSASSPLYTALAVNTSIGNSRFFQSMWDKEKYDFMIKYFRKSDGKWEISFYTDKPGVDVSEIAKSFNGGGHVQAAGCVVDTLPF